MGVENRTLKAVEVITRELPRLIPGNFIFHDKLQVSIISKFGDSKWTLYDPENPSMAPVRKDNYEIDWSKLPLPDAMILELKKICFVRIAVKGAVPGTVGLIKTSVRLFYTVLVDCSLRGFFITSLTDISIRNFKKALEIYGGSKSSLYSHVRTLLLDISTNPVFTQCFSRMLPWGRKDIENLPLTKGPKGKGKNKKFPVPSALFVERSNRTRAIIHDYLVSIGHECEDNNDDNPYYMSIKTSGKCISDQYPEFKNMHEIMIGLFMRKSKNAFSGSNISYHFNKARIKIDRKTMRKLMLRARRAAYSIILQFTGMRTSEARSICTKCSRIIHGLSYLVGTVAKGRAKDGSIECDTWVAIDAMRDAVKVLELQRPMTGNNKYLFSALKIVKKHRPSLHLSGLRDFIYDLLKDTHWKQWLDYHGLLTPNSDRHTLVRELANIGVGLPALTRQLHHLAGHLTSARISDTTLGYGNIGDSRQSITIRHHFDSLNTEITNAMVDSKVVRMSAVFGEEASLAGVNAHKVKEEIDIRFAGIGLSGEERDQYIDEMVRNGFEMPVCGFGLCGDALLPGTQVEPCKGDLSCDDDCPNKIYDITQKETVLHLFRGSIKQQMNRIQKHNRSIFAEQEHIWANIIRQWGDNPDAIKKDFIAELNANYGG